MSKQGNLIGFPWSKVQAQIGSFQSISIKINTYQKGKKIINLLTIFYYPDFGGSASLFVAFPLFVYVLPHLSYAQAERSVTN